MTDGPRPNRTQARALEEEGIDALRSCLIADRAWDGDAFRAWRAQKGIEAVIPARRRRTNPQPHDPRYQARNAVARGLSWLKWCRRVAIRYDQYAHRCLGFLCLAAA